MDYHLEKYCELEIRIYNDDRLLLQVLLKLLQIKYIYTKFLEY